MDNITSTTSSFSFADWANVTDGASNTVTALAVVIGGGWAYFKFFKGRTYRPRLAVKLSGQWKLVGGVEVLLIRVEVTNIGASMVTLKQYGSGLQISFPALEQSRGQVTWEPTCVEGEDVIRTFELLEEHEWIEPGETISDGLLLRAEQNQDFAMLELRLIWNTTGDQSKGHPKGDIEFFAREIIVRASPSLTTAA